MTKPPSKSRWAEIVSGFLLAAALATIQVLIGGTRLLFSLPAYGLLAGVGLFSLFSLRRSKPDPDRLCLVTAALFFGYILTRAFLSPVDYLARADIYSVLAGLLIYFFVGSIFTDARRRMMIVSFLLVLALVHVGIGAVQFRDGNNFMLIPFLQRYDYGRRASGFYVCPNHLAGLLEVLAIFSLSFVCWSRWSALSKLLVGYACAVCYVGIILTGSRGGYLSTAASLIVFGLLSAIVLRRGPERLFLSVMIPALVVAAVLTFTTVFFVQKSNFLSARAEATYDPTNARLDYWKAAVQQWKLQPVWGTGSGTYLYYGRQFRTERVQVDPVYVHNDYLQLLADYGIVGGVLFLVFLAAHWWSGWWNFQRLGPKRVAVSHRMLSNGMGLQIGALSALAAYMVHSFLDFNLHIPANVLLMSFVFGLLANSGLQRESEPVEAFWPGKAWRLVPAAIAITIAIQCFRLFPGEYYTECARTALRDNKPDAAIRFALEGLAWERKNPYLYRYLGSAQIDRGDEMTDPEAKASAYREAVSTFEEGRSVAPLDKNFAVSLGMAYDELGRFAEAEWMLEEALSLDPRAAPTHDIYAAHLQKWGGKTTATN